VITWKDNSLSNVQQIVKIPDEVLVEALDILPSKAILCEGSTLTLDARKLGNVRWQDGSIASQFTVTEAGNFWFNTCLSGCILSDTVMILLEKLIDPLGADTTLCEQQAKLELSVNPDHILEWQDKTTTPTYTVTKPGVYWAIIQTQNCILKDSIVVDFCKDAIFIPNVITPNGDLANDNFVLLGVDTEKCSLRIFDRHGILQYESKSYRNDWNGKELPGGVYYYQVDNSVTHQSLKGWLHIVR